jgi:hypothetical protein
LSCEAKPLIKAWQLKKRSDANHPFTIYSDPARVIVITGMGKVAMAGAIGYTMALFANPTMPIIVNLGIAGHRHFALGSPILAGKIIDSETNRGFYPQLPFATQYPTATIATHSHPQVQYLEDYVYDMEATGFYEIAVKFSSCELIQVVKVISDNAQSPISVITETAVESWVNSQLANIQKLIEQLTHLRSLSLPGDIERIQQQLSEQFHLTVSHSIKLKALLHRWRLLKGDAELNWVDARPKNAKELLSWIEAELDRMDFYL